MTDFEKLGAFYLGRLIEAGEGEPSDVPLLYDAKDLTTHAVCVGMTGSGKTGLCIGLLEEAAIDGVPAICIDPKGDLGNLLLTFPELAPKDFEPWIDPAEAERAGQSTDRYAQTVAERWREGLASWGQDGARIGRFRDSVDLAIYTPGSGAGRPLRVLEALSPPEGADGDADWMQEAIESAVSGLLALVGIEPDPINSKEHILLSNILAHAWRNGDTVGLADLIRFIADPPFDRIGVMDADTFYPASERQKLAMRINGVVAAPGFSAWLEGEPLDVQRLLWTEDGKPRLSILSIAHLSDAERMFFVSTLLSRVVSWVRKQSGTSSLRALLYMDEVFGFLPPVANPPSKAPLLTLLKQARAFGFGVMLATQNPVDIDYKALSNCGTWFLGRLQTERDVARVLDGLEGASEHAGGAFARADFEKLLAGLRSRVFLVNNAHEDAPALFHTRWAMSYLRGPLTRNQIKRLTPEPRAEEAHEGPVSGVVTRSLGPAADALPALPAGVDQVFLSHEPGHYVPHLIVTASLHHTRATYGLDQWSEQVLLAPLGEPDPWDGATRFAPDDAPESLDEPPEDSSFTSIPAGTVGKARLRSYGAALKRYLYKEDTISLWQCKPLKLKSEPGETKADFAARAQLAYRERRDAQLDKLRARLDKKLKQIEDRIRRGEARVEREKSQYDSQKLQTGISMGATVLGAIFGSRGLGRATTTARGAGRIAKEREDVVRAEEDVRDLEDQRRAIEEELDAELRDFREETESHEPVLEEVVVRPKKADIRVSGLRVAWKRV
ncbi:MAG: DUF87 domain-containing protein [Myxococcota bacterium]